MQRRWVILTMVVILCSLAASAQAAEISGSFGIGADALPGFTLDADFDVTIADDVWSISSSTGIGLVPDFAISELVSAAYDLDFVHLAASISMALDPFTAEAGILAATQLFALSLREEAPEMELSSDLTIGTSIAAAIDPYAQLYTELSLGDHWLSNTTTVAFIPLDVTSSVLGYVSFGQIGVADAAVIVTPTIYVSLGVVPFGFGYVQANADVAFDGVTIRNSVTYSGGSAFAILSTATVDLEPITISLWGSFNSVGTNPFGLGANASVSWGPL